MLLMFVVVPAILVCRNCPCTSEILQKTRHEISGFHWIKLQQVVVSAALAWHKHANAGEIVCSAHLGTHGSYLNGRHLRVHRSASIGYIVYHVDMSSFFQLVQRISFQFNINFRDL